MREEIERLREQYQFFHWHLAFPQVFMPEELALRTNEDVTGWTGGFDVVLGNPPWERIKLQEKEWFASRSPEIAGAPNAAARGRLIEALQQDDPALSPGLPGRPAQGGGREPLRAQQRALSALRPRRRQHLRHLCRAGRHMLSDDRPGRHHRAQRHRHR